MKGSCRFLALSLAAASLAALLPACARNAQRSAAPADEGPKRSARQIESNPAPGFLEQYAATNRFRSGEPTSISVTPEGDAVLFLRSGPRTKVQDLFQFDPATGETVVLLTADDILGGEEEELTAEELARRERMRLSARGIATYDLSKDGSQILTNLSGTIYVIDRKTKKVNALESERGFPIDPQFSPDGSKVASVRDDEVVVTDIATGEETQITFGAGGTISHGTAEFVAQEEMRRRHGYWWSPDSTRIVYQQTDTAGLETMHIMDPTDPAVAPQTWPYPRPGKKNAEVRLGVTPIDAPSPGQTVWFDWDRERYPYLATVKWPENAPLTLVVQNRRQTEHVILKADPDTGETTVLHVERDPAWINLDQQMPRWLKDGSGFLWTTERDGWWTLELRDATGDFMRRLTEPSLGYRSLEHLDEEAGALVVNATAGDPTERHLLRVPMEPGAFPVERLTRLPGVHGANFSKDGSIYVHSFHTMDGKKGHVVRSAGGEALGMLPSLAEKPPFTPEPELFTLGTRDFRAVVIRPRDFTKDASYPVIVHVYGGPHNQMVTKSPGRYLLNQWIADHGFIVVSMDGRGTESRGRDWERAIKGNLIDIPLKDQVRALDLLGRRIPEMDLSRVGIYGWSFGGYFSAHAALRRPDVFHAAVAGAPVTDWLDYDTHYTERYMDLPETNPAGYRASNAMTYAESLEIPLLLIHGTADDNVYFMHTLKLVDALLRAGQPFDFVPLAGFTHMVAEPEVVERMWSLIVNYFEQHLGDPELGTAVSRR